jgi:fumarate hydratase, class II
MDPGVRRDDEQERSGSLAACHARTFTEKPMSATRTEHDSMGSLEVPADALWGAQTQRAVQNFRLSGRRMPRAFLRALGLIKAAAATANGELGLLTPETAQAIRHAALAVADGRHDRDFPVDPYQTGSGTSSNMNANEVIATLASRECGAPVHPNDQVNLGQSSNDVIPSAIQVAAALQLHDALRPALAQLRASLDRRAEDLAGVVKTGRTHLMDAMPLTLGQELATWSAQLAGVEAALGDTLQRLRRLPLGGTAIGTGINAHPDYADRAIATLAALAGVGFEPAANRFAGIAGQDAAVELSGQLNLLATVLMKIANDLRWMNSGPLAGLGEIELPALQPGSSIMPGKVNPVIPEALAMICAQVTGLHTAVTIAAHSGNFQLNVMLPLVAVNVLDAIDLLANGCQALATQAIDGFRVRHDRLDAALARNPVLVTALNPVIGYERAAAIAKRAYAEGRPVLEVAIEMSGIDEAELRRLLDPAALTRGGLAGG